MKTLFLVPLFILAIFFAQSQTASAITTAACQASGQGASCNYSTFGGNGCDDESWTSDTDYEKDLGVCDSSGAVQHCCVKYVSLCSKVGGKVVTGSGRSSARCNPSDTIPYQWGSSKCCVGSTTGGTTPNPNPGGTTPNPNPGGATPNPNPGGTTPNPNPGGATPNPNPATPTLGNNVQISFEAPTKYTTVETFLDSVLGFARNIVVILALVFLVIGAILYITSGGNDKRIGAAKSAITAALIGLAIVMVAPAFLKELAGVLGWDDLPSQASDALSLTQIAMNVLNFLLSVIGIIAIIMFLIGGMMYLTSAGDEKRAETGKKIVTSAIIGIIVAFSALVIVKQLATFFVN